MPWGDCIGPWWAQGKGFGSGRGRGMGYGRWVSGMPFMGFSRWTSPETEKEFLDHRIRLLEEELEYLRNRKKAMDEKEL